MDAQKLLNSLLTMRRYEAEFRLNLRDLTITCPANEVQPFRLGMAVEFDPQNAALKRTLDQLKGVPPQEGGGRGQQ